jgi:hypothetical protein
MREHVSLRWVLENVYQLTDEDMEVVIKERAEDTVRDGRATAEVERMSAMAQASAQPAAPAGMEGRESPRGLALIERKLDALPKKLRSAITEQELDGKRDRVAEKRATDKLDRLLRQGDAQVRTMREQGALMREIAFAKAK